MSLSIDAESGLDRSLEEIVGPTKTAMLYGFHHCHYNDLHAVLTNMQCQVYGYSLSNSYKGPKDFPIFPRFPKHDTLTKECQASLALFVIENYRKKHCGVTKFSPILFCIDTNDNQFKRINLSDSQEYKTLRQERLIIVKELRRAYKLCCDPSVDKRIRAVAKRTFVFLKVISDSQGKIIEIQKIPPPWTNAINFNPAIAKKAKNPNNWRFQVNVADYLMNGKYKVPVRA